MLEPHWRIIFAQELSVAFVLTAKGVEVVAKQLILTTLGSTTIEAIEVVVFFVLRGWAFKVALTIYRFVA